MIDSPLELDTISTHSSSLSIKRQTAFDFLCHKIAIDVLLAENPPPYQIWTFGHLQLTVALSESYDHGIFNNSTTS